MFRLADNRPHLGKSECKNMVMGQQIQWNIYNDNHFPNFSRHCLTTLYQSLTCVDDTIRQEILHLFEEALSFEWVSLAKQLHYVSTLPYSTSKRT